MPPFNSCWVCARPHHSVCVGLDKQGDRFICGACQRKTQEKCIAGGRQPETPARPGMPGIGVILAWSGHNRRVLLYVVKIRSLLGCTLLPTNSSRGLQQPLPPTQGIHDFIKVVFQILPYSHPGLDEGWHRSTLRISSDEVNNFGPI